MPLTSLELMVCMASRGADHARVDRGCWVLYICQRVYALLCRRYPWMTLYIAIVRKLKQGLDSDMLRQSVEPTHTQWMASCKNLQVVS